MARFFSRKILLIATTAFFALTFASSFQSPNLSPSSPAFGAWAKTQLDSLTLEEKIGQLFMVAAYSNKEPAHVTAIENLIKNQHIGGMIFMQGGPGRQINLANRYQKLSRIPLLVAQDAEWGLAMRLDSVLKYPRNMALGAIQDSTLLFEYGRVTGLQLRRVGVQVNFAPVVDVNNNPANPVIGDRSFGENKFTVARNGVYYTKGLEAGGVIGCAKHFPGHGDTGTDSHFDLPIINHSKARLNDIELYPFKEMIKAGVPSMMIAHLYIPALDSTPNRASTLSPKIVTGLLRNELGFKGLVFTDALGMQGVAKFFPPGEADLMAFLAGNDVLLFSGDVAGASLKIKAAVQSGVISMEELDKRVMKILLAKEWLGLNKERTVPSLKNINEINTVDAISINQRLCEASLTLVKNNSNLVPIQNPGDKKIACVEIGGKENSLFAQTLKKYADVPNYWMSSAADKASRDRLTVALKNTEVVIVSIDDMTRNGYQSFGVSAGTQEYLKSLQSFGKKVILCVFGSAYSLRLFSNENTIIECYENTDAFKIAAAEGIFGGVRMNGKLPVTASAQFKEGTGIDTGEPFRFAFGIPEMAGMDSDILNKSDSISKYAIQIGATPGCAVLVMRGNRIVYEKGFGKTEYDGGVPIDAYAALYDLASCTKVCATTMAVMHLVDEGKINLDESIATYLPEFRGQNKTNIKIRNLLNHNAGFKSWIPFYTLTNDSAGKKQLNPKIYSQTPGGEFCQPVAKDLYMCQDYSDTLWAKIVQSDVKTEAKVLYSDLSMIVMAKIVERIAGKSLDQYVDSVFYRPLGMNNTMFNPAICAPGKLCPPTEMDNYWRGRKIQGYVHDQTSAMMGGIAGHAGLFANVYDIAKLMMMMNNKGSSGSLTFIKPETVQLFTSKQLSDSRRGLGWDKPDLRPGYISPCSGYASAETFGHTGFTGTCIWVDPQYKLTFIFLSNRTFPTMENKKLISENIRYKIQDLVYESILSYEMKTKRK